MWDLNVKSQFFLIKESHDMLIASKENGGNANICMISSVTGTTPNNLLGVYAMTKAALDNMVKFLAVELMGDGIRINGIAPGLIKTEFSGPLWQRDNLDP